MNDTELIGAVRSALAKMPENEREEMLAYANELREALIVKRGKNVGLGEDGALMVLAACGLAMSRKRFGDAK